MSYSNKKEQKGETLPPMPKKDKNAFLRLAKIQSYTDNEHEMHYYLTRWLDERSLKWNYDAVGNIIVVKGDAEIYPCVVAHMDTVHDIVPNFKVFVTKTKDTHEMWYAKSGNKKSGIGGDDKCGIFAGLYVLEHLDAVKVVFFTQEESGCVGSSSIDISLLDDIGYVIQLDRWGRHDFICKSEYYSFVSDEFQHALEDLKKEFGYEDEEGLSTDVMTLGKRDIGVCCVNLSCGYYMHHTDSEKIDLNQFYNSLMFMMGMIETLGNNGFYHEKKHTYVAPKNYNFEQDYYADNAVFSSGAGFRSHINQYDSYKDKPDEKDGAKPFFTAEKDKGTISSDLNKKINDKIDKWEAENDNTQINMGIINAQGDASKYLTEVFYQSGVQVFSPVDEEILAECFKDHNLEQFNSQMFTHLSNDSKYRIFNSYWERTGSMIMDYSECPY